MMKENERTVYADLLETLKNLDMVSLLILRTGAEMLDARQKIEEQEKPTSVT